jgi:hypothetical protein
VTKFEVHLNRTHNLVENYEFVSQAVPIYKLSNEYDQAGVRCDLPNVENVRMSR